MVVARRKLEKCCQVDVCILQVPIRGDMERTPMLPIRAHARSRTQTMKFWLGDALPRDRSADKISERLPRRRAHFSSAYSWRSAKCADTSNGKSCAQPNTNVNAESRRLLVAASWRREIWRNIVVGERGHCKCLSLCCTCVAW